VTIEFEWDEQKRLSNLEKHGIDFVRACQIFEGFTVEFEDNRYDYEDTWGELNSPPRDVRGEERFIAIGEINGQILTVVCTYRGDAIRLISARPATRYERNLYYSDNY
jgi:uncharacterized protein